MKLYGEMMGFAIGNTEDILKSYSTAERHKKLFHYTNVDALLKILNHKTLKFNGMDSVNDLKEKSYFNSEMYKTVFICSFVHNEEEMVPMWNTYTNDIYGVRIGFINERGSILNALLGNRNRCVTANDGFEDSKISLTEGCSSDDCINGVEVSCDQKDIIYNESALTECPIDFGGGLSNIYSMAICKSNYWKYEEESRFVANLRTVRKEVDIPEFRFLFIPIELNEIDGIEITFSPYMPPEIQEMIKREVNTYGYTCKITFCESKLQDIIKRK